jgi:Zn-dependent metalloprotease
MSARMETPVQPDPDASFADAATDTVQAARLLYGGAAAAAVTKAFKDRKIL